MFGTFQQSHLRIEVNATEESLRTRLTDPQKLQQWLWFERLSLAPSEKLAPGVKFVGRVGLVPIQHEVELVEPNRIRFLLSQGIDGFHEWAWGNGWVQSRIEGVSLLPLNFGQTVSLLSLRQALSGDQ